MIEITIKLDNIEELGRAIRSILNPAVQPLPEKQPEDPQPAPSPEEPSEEEEPSGERPVIKRGRNDERKNEIIRLYNEGRKPAEIAAALGLKVGTVNLVLYRLRKKGEIADRKDKKGWAKKLPASQAYCQNAKCPYGGTSQRDYMVKRNQLLFCSVECADAWEAAQKESAEPAIETTNENP